LAGNFYKLDITIFIILKSQFSFVTP